MCPQLDDIQQVMKTCQTYMEEVTQFLQKLSVQLGKHFHSHVGGGAPSVTWERNQFLKCITTGILFKYKLPKVPNN